MLAVRGNDARDAAGRLFDGGYDGLPLTSLAAPVPTALIALTVR